MCTLVSTYLWCKCNAVKMVVEFRLMVSNHLVENG